MAISNKRSLIIALVLGQLACLIAGGFLFHQWLTQSLRNVYERQVLHDNSLIADQFAKLIEHLDLEDVQMGSSGWEKLQQAVEGIQLPNEGYVCVTKNPTGAILCHPELRRHPNLAHMMPGKAVLDTGQMNQSIVDLMYAKGDASGRAKYGDGIHLVAARWIPKLDVNVMVHQRRSGINRSIASVTQPIFSIAIAVSLVIVVATSTVTGTIVRRYECQLAVANARLATANDLLEEKVQQRTRALEKTKNATIFGLAKLAESRDTDTGDHLERIRLYTVLLAETMSQNHSKINKGFIEDIALASSLHDIGKVGIPDSVLLKPGKLTREERKIIETHTLVGGDCLAEIERRLGEDGFLELARQIAYSHHERWDGKGYPHGLSSEDIPLAARIVSVADVYDALTSTRPYKDAWSHEDAYDLIVNGANTQFDPEVVAAFITREKEFYALSTHHSAATELTQHLAESV